MATREHNYTKASQHNLRTIVNAFFKFLIKEKLIDRSPTDGIKPIREKTIKHNILTPKQVQILLSKLKEHSPGLLYPIILTAYYAAAKKNELLALKWDQVNFERETISFLTQEKIQARTLHLHPALNEALKAKKMVTNYVFVDYKRNPLSHNHLRCFLKEFRVKNPMGFEWTTTDLRNSFAAHFLQNGGDIKELKRIVGHKSIHVTREVFGEYSLN